jgi:hypothetical protein
MEAKVTDEQRNKLAVEAALAFMTAEPAFVAIPENSKVIVEYLESHPELNPVEMNSYQQAFRACRDRLRFEHQMTSSEFLKAVVVPAWRKQQQKPRPSDVDVFLKRLFEGRGIGDSTRNRALVSQYMREHNLDYSEENLTRVIETLSEYPGLEPSDDAIEKMPSSEYKKIVEKQFREWQAEQPQPKPSERPFGIRSYSDWLHSR